MNRRVFGAGAARLAALSLIFVGSAAFVGCGGPDQSTGSTATVNQEAIKQQDAMKDFYSKNPLPKPKKHP